MICTSCGTENERGRKFCLECGAKLASGCPNCGAANPPGAKFCGECGTTLTADAGAGTGGAATTANAAATAQPAGPIAERRVVSVLFADLVGFTAASEGRDAEETRDLLSRYFELARDVIGRYGGTVEKFIGDAVMAVWGAPTAHEDDAERAVRAGLELVDAIHGLGPGMEARAGVLTGEAAVTMNATNQGMVAGDLVNTASRLQSVALPGTVLVGEATHRAASKAIAFEEAGEQSLKGKTSPVPAWRALRVVAEVGGRNRSEALEAPFVGRDEELRLLKDLFHATSRDKRVRLVSVIGPAGIGKSRLAWEFLKYIDGLTETVWWHDGRSPAYGDGITFWALGEMIRERCHLLASDDDATTRQRVREAVEEWIPDEAERRWVESALLALLGLGGGGQAAADAGAGPTLGSDELFAAWRTFFERIAAKGTVVMVFEDLHWADTGLLDFIDHLLEWSRGLPIYVVTLARPDLLERRSDWGAGKRNFTSLSLEPLTTTAMRQLLAGLVPGLPEHVAQHIAERADGIPLYAVETIRMLLAEGRLREEDGAYRPVGPLTSLAVPETLQALISARLDGLEPADRSVLQDAAVLGQSFTAAGVGAVSGLDQAELEPRLRTLVRRELLIVEADPRSPERGQYKFVQSLIREVAYNTLARAERKSRHLAAARWFEALDEGELAGALAAQYVAAYRNAPEGPEAEALVGQARIALKGAAERAASLGSNRQALGFVRQAIEISDDEAERIALLERAGGLAVADAQFEAGRDYFEETIAWHRAHGDLRSVARATALLGSTLIGLSQPVAALKVLEAGEAETDTLVDAPEVVRLLTELSRAYSIAGDPRATATADRALEAAERLDLIPSIAEALLNRALGLGFTGHHEEPIALLRGTIVLAEAHGLGITRLRAMNNLSAMLQGDDPREALVVSEGGVELARRLGDRRWLTFLLLGMTGQYISVGDMEQAQRNLAEFDGVELSVPVQVSLAEAVATVRAMRGEIAGAEEAMAAVEPLRSSIDDPRVEGWRLSTTAIIDLMADRLEDAYANGIASARHGEDGAEMGAELAGMAALWLGDAARARVALDLHRARNERGALNVAARLRLEAGCRALEGDRAGALTAFRSAMSVYRDRDLPMQLGFSLLDYALIGRPDRSEATAAVDEARAIFTRAGWLPLLARLDAGVADATADKPARTGDAADAEDTAVESTAG